MRCAGREEGGAADSTRLSSCISRHSLGDSESRAFVGFSWSLWLLHCLLPTPKVPSFSVHRGFLLWDPLCGILPLLPPLPTFLLLLNLLLSPRLILLMVVCSQHLGSCQLPPCPWRPASSSSTCTRIPVFRLLSVCAGLGGAVKIRRSGMEHLLNSLSYLLLH